MPEVLMVPRVLLPPVTPFTCHVTAVLERLLTVAVKRAVLPNRTWLPPLTVTDGGPDCVVFVETLPQPASKVTRPSANTRTRCECGSRESCKTDLRVVGATYANRGRGTGRSEEHTSELQ